MKRILLIAGGWSPERNVSLISGENIKKSLQSLGYDVTWYDPQHSLDGLPKAVENRDFAFIALHGSPGEDGLVQAMLERLNVPYQGSGPEGSILALDKAASKVLFKTAGLRVAPSLLLSGIPDKGWQPPFPAPLFIKANTSGSSLNLAYIQDAKDLDKAFEDIFRMGNSFLVEQAITGVEVTCGVLADLGNGIEVPKALPPVLIKSNTSSGLFDYESKYTPGGAEEICPAPLPEAVLLKIQEMSITAHQVLGLAGYSRSDFILPDDNNPVILETNTLPGMTPASLMPKEVDAIGMGYDGLLLRLIELGTACKRRGNA